MKTMRLTGPLLPGKFHIGFRGLGVLGSTIPSSGTDGPGYGYPSVDAGDLNEELRFPITAPLPAGGAFNENTSFTYSGPSTSFTFRKVRAGVDQGTATATLNTGTAALVSADLAISYAIDSAALVSADLALSYAINAMQLVSADLAISYAILQIPVAPPDGGVDAGGVPPSRKVFFSGGTRVVTFQGGTRTVRF